MVLDSEAVYGERAAEATLFQIVLSICSMISMISVVALCTTAHCCRRKAKKGELDEPYGIINAGETATADAQACAVAFRNKGLPVSAASDRFSQPASTQAGIHGRQILQRASVPLAQPPSPMHRALPRPPLAVPVRESVGSSGAVYSAIDKTDAVKHRIQSIPYIEDTVNPTYESIDAETDSFSDPLYSKLENENRIGRRYDYPMFASQSRTNNEEAVYQSASQIYAAGSEDPYSSITSQSGGDDPSNLGFTRVGKNVFSFDHLSSERPSTSKDIDQLYTKIQRGASRRTGGYESPSVPFSAAPNLSPFDFNSGAYPTSESGKTSREPSYRYITVRESVDVIRQRLSEREQDVRNELQRARGITLNSSGLPVREHFYASIEGGSDYESVSGNAIYEHLPEDLDEKHESLLPRSSLLSTGADQTNIDPNIPPKPPTSPIPSHKEELGTDRGTSIQSTSYSANISSDYRPTTRTGSTLIAGPYNYFSVKSSGTASRIPSTFEQHSTELKKNFHHENVGDNSSVQDSTKSLTTSPFNMAQELNNSEAVTEHPKLTALGTNKRNSDVPPERLHRTVDYESALAAQSFEPGTKFRHLNDYAEKCPVSEVSNTSFKPAEKPLARVPVDRHVAATLGTKFDAKVESKEKVDGDYHGAMPAAADNPPLSSSYRNKEHLKQLRPLSAEVAENPVTRINIVHEHFDSGTFHEGNHHQQKDKETAIQSGISIVNVPSGTPDSPELEDVKGECQVSKFWMSSLDDAESASKRSGREVFSTRVLATNKPVGTGVFTSTLCNDGYNNNISEIGKEVPQETLDEMLRIQPQLQEFPSHRSSISHSQTHLTEGEANPTNSFANSSPGPSSPTDYRSKFASLPNYKYNSREDSDDVPGRNVASAEGRRIRANSTDIDGVFYENEHVAKSAGDHDAAPLALCGSDRGGAIPTAWPVIAPSSKQNLPNSKPSKGKERWTQGRVNGSPHGEEVFQPLVYKGALEHPKLFIRACRNSSQATGGCTDLKCFCHCGEEEPKIEVVVESNRAEMKKINWEELPLRLCYEE